jgi:hypothetical protein
MNDVVEKLVRHASMGISIRYKHVHPARLVV